MSRRTYGNTLLLWLKLIRDALKDFKESGKFIVAYSDTYTQNLYYLSSVADKVLLNPQGMLEWRGLAATPMFFKDLLEKIGVEMQIFKVGTYKSAVEPFISTEMSPANREQVNVYLSSIWGQITSSVAESRNLSVEALNKEADRMLMFYPAEESVKNGLVDTLIYKNDVRDYLKNIVGIDKDDNMPVLGIQDMINVKKNVPRDKSGNVIAVYYAYGEIDGGSSASTDEGINSEKVIKDLRKLKDGSCIQPYQCTIRQIEFSMRSHRCLYNHIRKVLLHSLLSLPISNKWNHQNQHNGSYPHKGFP